MNNVTVEQKMFSMSAYVPILGLIPLLVKKDDDFVHFHAKQGLILFILWIIIFVIAKIPFYIGAVVAPLLTLAELITIIIALVKVSQGKKWEIPVVYRYADKLNM